MKILYLNIPTFFANKDMLDAFESYMDENGDPLDVIAYPYIFDENKARNDTEFEQSFLSVLRRETPDFVFSFNFLPVVSKVCKTDGVCYVSWIYNNPEIFLYSYQVINPCNLVLMFDSKQYETFRKGGIDTVEYLPLAASARRLDALIPDEKTLGKFGADISFVGSLYTERQQYYERIVPKLSDFHRGYLEGLIKAQLQVDGVNFIEECLPKDLVDAMQSVSNISPYPDSAETPEYLFANYVINRQITLIERREILSYIGEHFPVSLYTYKQNSSFHPTGVTNKGPAEYFNEMPYVFKCSKINLNITLRSIQNGIPLRAYDVLGCGGFLLSNYQTDLARHFVPNEDYVYYENREDLLKKIEYYLSHEDERSAIAQNAHDRVVREHTFDVRAGQIIEMVKARK